MRAELVPSFPLPSTVQEKQKTSFSIPNPTGQSPPPPPSATCKYSVPPKNPSYCNDPIRSCQKSNTPCTHPHHTNRPSSIPTTLAVLPPQPFLYEHQTPFHPLTNTSPTGQYHSSVQFVMLGNPHSLAYDNTLHDRYPSSMPKVPAASTPA